ncbi:MAG: ABC transporter permease [Rhodospirillales bacterium]|nr:ABC transporter permease [Rhodospirillales bacterium]
MPALLAIAVLAAWEGVVRLNHIPPYVLPGPVLIAQTLWRDAPDLLAALIVTLRIALEALVIAVVGGLALAVLLVQSRWIERSVYPWLIALQVTPIVAIAPLIIIWVDDVSVALLICAAVVAFFPIVANATQGLNSVDAGLVDLFRLYRASRWQTLVLLRLPTALPYILGGVRISGGLALIGAIVAEFVAGTGGSESGLAYRILEAGYRLQIPRLFAALLLLSTAGVLMHAALAWVSRYLLRHR